MRNVTADIEDRHHGPKHPSDLKGIHYEYGNPARASHQTSLGRWTCAILQDQIVSTGKETMDHLTMEMEMEIPVPIQFVLSRYFTTSVGIKMSPRRSEGEESEYPFFEGDGSSSNEWGDYGVAGNDYEGPPVFDDDQYEEESMPVYDIDIEDVIEEEEGFIEKGGFGREEDNIENIVVVTNDLCSSMIQTTSNVDFEKDINTKSHQLMSFGKGIIIKVSQSSFKFLIRKQYQEWYFKAAPMVDKFSFKTIKVRGRVIIKKESLMQGIQIWMLRVQGT
ncbi:hypothetical protein Tco_0536211, partial [Tanacetum coccineum]